MDEEDAPRPKSKTSSVYGRGFFDGLRAAGVPVEKGFSMNEARFNAIYRGITDQAKRVYQVVPIAEKWTVPQIMTELARINGTKDVRIVSGCLNSLKDSGLVKEVSGGAWMRVEVKIKQPAVAVIEAVAQPEDAEPVPAINMKPEPTPVPKTVSPMERIGALSSQALAIIQSLHQLAADIEAAALEIEEQMESNNRDNAKLQQLKELLKGLT
jgi:hypothetical protein